MVRVSIIGSGNVAQHLIAAFLKNDEIELLQAYSRNPKTLSDLLPAGKITDDLSALKEADIYIIAVSDSAVIDVSNQLVFNNRFVVHTAGSLAADAIDSKNRNGVFYPIQTFSKNRALDFKTIPICIEADDPNDLQLLIKVAKAISGDVIRMTSAQRRALHVAAVFVNNFANHLLVIADDICRKNEIPFHLMKPLIRETAEKAIAINPREAQTGPAIRKDDITIETHLAFLTDEHQKKIYKMLTNSIQHESRL